MLPPVGCMGRWAETDVRPGSHGGVCQGLEPYAVTFHMFSHVFDMLPSAKPLKVFMFDDFRLLDGFSCEL